VIDATQMLTVDFVPVAGRGLHLVAATFREECDVHRFGDGTLRAGLEIVLRLCVLVDDLVAAWRDVGADVVEAMAPARDRN
jgi:hypothetical protein